jgi:hypothetical protein
VATPDAPDPDESQVHDDDQTPLAPPEATAMSDAALASAPSVPLPAHLLRPLVAPLTEEITERIQAEVPTFSDSSEHGSCQLLRVAVQAGVSALLDVGPGRESGSRKVDELFRRLGHGEALHGKGTEPLTAALRIAIRCAWEHLAEFAVAQQCSASTLRDIASSLLAHTDHLRDLLIEGYELGHRHTYHSRRAARDRLFDIFAQVADGTASPLQPLGMDAERLRQMADEAEWPLPRRVVALAVTYHGDPPELPDRDDILTRVEGDRVVALCPEEDAEALISLLERSGPDRRVAISWPVPPVESPSALRWAGRALDLVSIGVIAPTRQVRCTEHATQLWLCAEPSMRQRLCQELLEPLLAESPNSREILSDTLLAWLETRDSAPAIAARLGVHPQTVRYRWKRIHDLFGDALQDSELILLVTMVLKTSVLMWKAGDESDVERYKDGKIVDP